MNRSSFFISDKARFGSFPTQEAVQELENHNVRCFVDLTGVHEKNTVPYSTKYRVIKYPILDNHIPRDSKSFSQLILEICGFIKYAPKSDVIYVHCKGGHGRSGIVVACVLCCYYNIPASRALELTSKLHSERVEMKFRWRRIGSPQSDRQKEFVREFFRPIFFTEQTACGTMLNYEWLQQRPIVMTQNDGTQKTYSSEEEAIADRTTKQAVDSIGTMIERQTKDHFMYNLLQAKFRQHIDLKNALMMTCLHPLVKKTNDPYWGIGSAGKGQNKYGALLQSLREMFLLEEIGQDIASSQ